MVKYFLLRFILVVCLLSFPLAAYAGDGDISVETVSSSTSLGTATVVGSTDVTSVDEYGFEFGKSTDYGQIASSTDTFNSHVLDWTAGEPGSGDGQFSSAEGIAVDSQGNIFVSDKYNNRVNKFDSQGIFVTSFGSYGTEDGQFSGPTGIAIDSNDVLLVVDSNNDRIQKFDSTGNYISKFGSPGEGDGQFLNPIGIAVDGQNNSYVTDPDRYKVQKFDASGTYVGGVGIQGSGDGEFQSLGSIAIDSLGSIYVGDGYNYRIQKFDPSFTFQYSINNSNFEHSWYFGLAIGESDYLYVAYGYASNVAVFDSEGNPIGTFGQNLVSESNSGNLKGLAIKDGHFIISHYSNILQISTNDELQPKFSLNLSPLECGGVTYHYRAYVVVGLDLSYGQDATFVTQACVDPPTIDSVTSTPTTAKLTVGGNQDVYIKVGYRQLESSSWSFENIDLRNSNEVLISSLVPNSDYIFFVASTNSYYGQTSSWSESASATTLEQQNYVVSNCRELQAIGVDPITKAVGDQEGKYTLSGDIDCSESDQWQWDTFDFGIGPVVGSGFMPIVDPENMSFGNSASGGFRGILDGNNHTVLNIAQETSIAGGVFGLLQGATIQDITFDNLQIRNTINDGFFGGLAFLDAGNSVIENVTVNGEISESTNQSSPKIFVERATGVAVGPSGNIFVLDDRSYNVAIGDTHGSAISSFGQEGTNDGEFSGPTDIAIDDSGFVYVADGGNSRIQKFDFDGNYISQFGSSGSGDGQFSNLQNIAVDGSGNVYATDASSQRVQKFNSSGNYVSQFTSEGYSGIVVDATGNIYVADESNGRVQKFDSAGNLLFSLGAYGSDDGQLNSPRGVALDSQGNIFVADSGNGRIAKFGNDGAFLANITSETANINLDDVENLALDSSDNIYVGARYDGVYKLSSAGQYIEALSGTSFGMFMVGGIIGYASPSALDTASNISNAHTDMVINYPNTFESRSIAIGGITAYGAANLSDSSSTGSITINGVSDGIGIGGLVGTSAGGAIARSFSTDDISVQGVFAEVGSVGGLVGTCIPAFGDGSGQAVIDSFWNGSISVNANSQFAIIVGGVLGYVYNGIADQVYSAGTIEVESESMAIVGGIVGLGIGSYTNSFTSVQLPTNPLAGNAHIVGIVVSVDSNFSNVYYDANKNSGLECYAMTMDFDSGQPFEFDGMDCHGVNAGGADPDYFNGNSTNAPLDGWDFENVWESNPSTYPTLRPIEVTDGGGGGESTTTTTQPATTTTTSPVTTTQPVTTTSPVTTTQPTTTSPVTPAPSAPANNASTAGSSGQIAPSPDVDASDSQIESKSQKKTSALAALAEKLKVDGLQTSKSGFSDWLNKNDSGTAAGNSAQNTAKTPTNPWTNPTFVTLVTITFATLGFGFSRWKFHTKNLKASEQEKFTFTGWQ